MQRLQWKSVSFTSPAWWLSSGVLELCVLANSSASPNLLAVSMGKTALLSSCATSKYLEVCHRTVHFLQHMQADNVTYPPFHSYSFYLGCFADMSAVGVIILHQEGEQEHSPNSSGLWGCDLEGASLPSRLLLQERIGLLYYSERFLHSARLRLAWMSVSLLKDIGGFGCGRECCEYN